MDSVLIKYVDTNVEDVAKLQDLEINYYYNVCLRWCNKLIELVDKSKHLPIEFSKSERELQGLNEKINASPSKEDYEKIILSLKNEDDELKDKFRVHKINRHAIWRERIISGIVGFFTGVATGYVLKLLGI